MHDFNFFEPYLAKGRQQQSADSIKFDLLAVLLLIILVSWPAYNFVCEYQLKRETSALKAEVATDEKYPLLEQSDALNQYITNLQGQLKAITDVDTKLKDGAWLNEPFLFSLLSTVPKDVQLQEIQVNMDKAIEISGVASNKPAIAELERNVRETDRFESLYMDSILNEDGTYSFHMQFQLKGGGTNAAN